MLDEVQRCPDATYVALRSNRASVVAAGGRGQEGTFGGIAGPGQGPRRQQQQLLCPPLPQAQASGIQAKPHLGVDLLSARPKQVALGAPSLLAVYTLIGAKRLGDPSATDL